MKIDQLDEKLITEPLSQQERLKLIKAFINRAYLKGIDKGTELERTTQTRVAIVKKNRFEKKFESFMDKLEDYINIHEKRVYREKYKGRYNYYIPKKNKKRKPSKYKQQQLW